MLFPLVEFPMGLTKERNGAPKGKTKGAPFVFTIYCHIHVDSGRRYIGLTKKTMMQRWNRHVYSATHVRPGSGNHFPNAIRKYGKDAFIHEVLEICDTLELANVAEIKWIDHFNTRDPQFGFNIAKGGDHVPHPHKNPMDRPEFREKALQSLAKANASLTPEKRSARAKDLWQDPEFRWKVTIASRQTWSDPEMRARSSEINKEIKARPEVKKKASESSQLMWRSEEYRVRNAELWKDPEFRARCQGGLIHGSTLNKSKTHCPKGHEYSVENTVTNSKGSRECLICKREWSRNWMREHRVRNT